MMHGPINIRFTETLLYLKRSQGQTIYRDIGNLMQTKVHDRILAYHTARMAEIFLSDKQNNLNNVKGQTERACMASIKPCTMSSEDSRDHSDESP